MLDIVIVAVGKIKEAPWLSASKEYLKRLKPYARVKILELQDVARSPREKNKETLRIVEALNQFKGSRVFVLDEQGKEMNTMEFSGVLNIEGKIVFVIGGPFGIDRELFAPNVGRLALSRLTFTHEMSRVLLLEQIYRGIAIIKNKNYHY